MPTTETARQEAVAALRFVREEWGNLLAAITTPPDPGFPPRSLAHTVEAQLDAEADPLVRRAPLVLREHPAPVHLDAVDTRVAVEDMLYRLADTLAAAVQRPARRVRVNSPGTAERWKEDEQDTADPERWHYPAEGSPGSRAYGPHWAAVYAEGRVLDEQLETGLFSALPEHLLHEAHGVARRCAERVERTLNRDRRTLSLDAPCPWCGGKLTGDADPDDVASAAVRCGSGEQCPAPVLLDWRGRRVWRGHDLVGLHTALAAVWQRSEAAA
ncbi:hypothetical protein K378_04041 [Streptomyces sp. Amel2xB2]|uniref:hypothetical protein n=1 Tax=Streptomyces sp. Amel2xB2 TaxID=1305829 RepID=UPI000DB962A2|nr:hypothetical protein [Streptomyces sp. Amel2xB2]RAJ61681.1 hypothetical protein K378_04041 [Streptomyces sp. Amel2xB2]